MIDGDILILKGSEVASLLAGREKDLISLVRKAYEAHAIGNSSLPHSTFLPFPDQPGNRIIALPAYLGDGFAVAGIKWVSSFPANIDSRLDRASAVIILNSSATGRPEAIIEGSIISAKRTAASAALAAQHLQNGKRAEALGLVGCGLINFEIVRFLLAALPEIRKLLILDLSPIRANEFKHKCEAFDGPEVQIAGDLEYLIENSSLISIATTATRPHIFDLSRCARGSTILHISLRDLSPEVILSCDNVVDDVDHVCRANTSIHLAEQLVGNRGFIRGALADILLRRTPVRKDNNSTLIFSPFGLGILDIAVGKLVRELAEKEGAGTVISSFLPDSWRQHPIASGDKAL
jgi:2,3-diaminopropionate biosynthesis protein SbnB